jgi:hypothetical protein
MVTRESYPPPNFRGAVHEVAAVRNRSKVYELSLRASLSKVKIHRIRLVRRSDLCAYVTLFALPAMPIRPAPRLFGRGLGVPPKQSVRSQ